MPDNKTNNGIELIIKFFSLLYVILITCGLTYNFFFYKKFGIVITEYIEIGEALLLFIPLLADAFIIMSVMGILMSFTNSSLFFGRLSFDPEYGDLKSLRKGANKVLVCLAILILLFYFFASLNIVNIRLPHMLLLMSVLGFGSYILESIFIFLHSTRKIIIPAFILNILSIFIIFISMVLWLSFSKSERVKRKRGYQNFEIIYNSDSTFKSDSNIYYLGRTKNYLFIHDIKIKKSRVISVSDIKEFVTYSE
jgi:hypothetical protein